MDDSKFEKVLEVLSQSKTEPKQTTFERHAQTALTGLITLLLAGTAGLLMTMKAAQSETSTDVKVLQIQFQNLSAQLKEQNRLYLTRPELIPYELRINRLEDFHEIRNK